MRRSASNTKMRVLGAEIFKNLLRKRISNTSVAVIPTYLMFCWRMASPIERRTACCDNGPCWVANAGTLSPSLAASFQFQDSSSVVTIAVWPGAVGAAPK